MTMTTFTKTVLSVGLSAALLAIALVAVPPASASPEAVNARSLYLMHPSDPLDPQACWSRRIRLGSGTYRWRTFDQHWARPKPSWGNSRSVKLTAGWYRWRDCLEPSPPPPTIHWGYAQTSQLTREATGGRAFLQTYMVAEWGLGTYTVGTRLAR